ncbi:transposable element Tcb2 transposase [Trichonephila clavipes]|uniref:Transposable element Tcb2 transposase n=1 Tax=Trichonephila clavipes TaxID=2585209 RepID=A0A8X6SD26_TRICX|nr:transposable element Tcb2 transposase [Trichonephila clavipes]
MVSYLPPSTTLLLFKSWSSAVLFRVIVTNYSQHHLIWREVNIRGFIPVTSWKEIIAVVLELSSGEALCSTGGLSSRFRQRLCVTGDCYYEERILPHVRLFRGAIAPDFVFMDNNVRPHRTADVEQLLESEDFPRMDWTAFFPDLNPIERL